MRTPSSFSVFAPVLMELVAPRRSTVYPLWAAALGLSFIALIAACFQSAYRLLFSLSLSVGPSDQLCATTGNFYLGEAQNAWDNKDTVRRHAPLSRCPSLNLA